MTSAEESYVEAFLRSLCSDLLEHPVPGALARIVIRWFQPSDPLYLGVHALGTGEESEVQRGDEWYPLEWPGEDREDSRADRIVSDPEVQALGEALAREQVELPEDEAWPAMVEVCRRAPEAIRGAGIETADYLLVLAAHFEGWGPLDVFERISPPAGVVDELRRRDALPTE